MSSAHNKKEVIVAIHQPNFFPWLGYFDKINKSDVFILMDNVQFPRTSRGTWINRVKFLINGKPSWVTCPVKRRGVTQLIKDIVIDDASPWRTKMLKTIEHSYKKTPFFKEYYHFIKGLVEFETTNLADFNMNVIRKLCELLDIPVDKLVKGSSLECSEQSTDLLIEMTKAVGGTAYMCGGGASGYQEDEKFKNAGIRLIYQNFNHQIYEQCEANSFMPGLSIIDTIFNAGLDGTWNLLGI